MRKVMIVAIVLIAQALFAQEIDVQDLFKKIEERNSGIKNLKTQGFVIFNDSSDKPRRIVEDITYSKDEFLSLEALVKMPTIGSAIINYIYLKDGLACKFTSAEFIRWGRRPHNLKISLAAKGQEFHLWTDYYSVFDHLTLFALNLAPSNVFKEKQLQVEKIKEGEKEYALLKYTITLDEHTPVICYLNLKELSFEKVVILSPHTQKPDSIIQVEKFNNIINTPLPQSIKISEWTGEETKIIFKSFQANLEGIEQPYWLSDKNLPEITKETSKELGFKIEKDPQNIKLLLQYLVTKFLEADKKFELIDNFVKEYEAMLSKFKEIETESVLLNDMELASLIGKGKLDECEEKFKQINYNSPHTIYLLALKLAEEGKDPSQFLEKIKQESIMKETALFEYKLSQIKTLQELQDILDGKTFEEKLFLCDRIEPGYTYKGVPLVIKYTPLRELVEEMMKKYVLSKALSREMEKKTEDDFIKLLLARYFVRKKKNEKASQYYVQISDKLFNFVQTEVEDFIKQTGGNAKLSERVMNTTKDTELLIKYALENVKSSEIDAIVKRLIESIKSVRHLFYESEQQLLDLSKKLLAEGKNDLLKQLLTVVIKQDFIPIHEEEIVDIIKKVTNNNKEEIYEMVKYEPCLLREADISDVRLRNIVIRKIKKDKADEVDFEIFVEEYDLWRIKNALNILEKAYEKFPLNLKIQEALGDEYVKSEQYQKAIKLYRNVLSRATRSSGGAFSSLEFDKFYHGWNVLVKFAFVAQKLDDKTAVEEIAKYEEKYKREKDMEVVAMAYAVLGRYDMAWEKYKEYVWYELKSRLPLPTLEWEDVYLNLAIKANQTLQAYVICEIVLDKLNKYEPKPRWSDQKKETIKRTIQKTIQKATKAKEALGITPQHFIDYILEQPYEEVEQSVKEKVQTLIKQLDSSKIKEREQSTEDLIKLGKKIAPLLKEHLNSASLEVQVRAKNILYKIGYEELKRQILQEWQESK